MGLSGDVTERSNAGLSETALLWSSYPTKDSYEAKKCKQGMEGPNGVSNISLGYFIHIMPKIGRAKDPATPGSYV